jgi:nucleotide-binding universal stress UspA family protein
MFQRILIATDLSPASAPALERGLHLARRLEAQVVLLYVCEPPHGVNPWFQPLAASEAALFASVIERLQLEARRRLEQTIIEAVRLGTADRVAIDPVVVPGVPADAIVEMAERRGCDLIVVGSHGRTGVSHALLGSVAEQRVAQPVVAVRADEDQVEVALGGAGDDLPPRGALHRARADVDRPERARPARPLGQRAVDRREQPGHLVRVGRIAGQRRVRRLVDVQELERGAEAVRLLGRAEQRAPRRLGEVDRAQDAAVERGWLGDGVGGGGHGRSSSPAQCNRGAR